MLAQNGLIIHQKTPITVTGCSKSKTRRQQLAAALKTCRTKHDRARRRLRTASTEKVRNP
jgi:hypothetical protein